MLAEVDECTLGTHTCDTNSKCINTVGSYNCECYIGYNGDGYNCTGKYYKVLK